MAINLDLAFLIILAACACSGTPSNSPSTGGTGALGGSSNNGGSVTDIGGATHTTSMGGHSSGGAPELGGSQATGGTRNSLITCNARPNGDSLCSGLTPHFFACFSGLSPNTGCKIRTIGDATDTYCCP